MGTCWEEVAATLERSPVPLLQIARVQVSSLGVPGCPWRVTA